MKQGKRRECHGDGGGSYVGGQGRPSDEVTSELTPDGSGTLGEEIPTLPPNTY